MIVHKKKINMKDLKDLNDTIGMIGMIEMIGTIETIGMKGNREMIDIKETIDRKKMIDNRGKDLKEIIKNVLLNQNLLLQLAIKITTMNKD